MFFCVRKQKNWDIVFGISVFKNTIIKIEIQNTFFFFDHDEKRRAELTERLVLIEQNKKSQENRKNRADVNFIKCEIFWKMFSEYLSCILMKSSPTTTTSTVWGVLLDSFWETYCERHIRSGSSVTELRVQLTSWGFEQKSWNMKEAGSWC